MCSLEMGEKSRCRQRWPGDQQGATATGAPDPAARGTLGEDAFGGDGLIGLCTGTGARVLTRLAGLRPD